jgi:glycine dehydrogenase
MGEAVKKADGIDSKSLVQEQSFAERHIGPRAKEVSSMLTSLGFSDIESFTEKTVPSSILLKEAFKLSAFADPFSEEAMLEEARAIAEENVVKRSLIGMGYADCFVPTVIERNVFQNPGWYTQYTPYQAEISQGRLEALLNFQTLVSELTGLPIANASLLDEGTACAEAMGLSFTQVSRKNKKAVKFFVESELHPQSIGVLKTRAAGLGIELVFSADSTQIDETFFGGIFQYPNTRGEVSHYQKEVGALKGVGALVTFACDPLALVLLKEPAALDADMAVGNMQRFGVPLGFGGPHAAFFACTEELKRLIPGRIVGVSKDRDEKPALRLALQTREQHIRREKATSNICTAQVLLAVMSSFYAVYHGPNGLRRIASNVRRLTQVFKESLSSLGIKASSSEQFDTLLLSEDAKKIEAILTGAETEGFNLRKLSETELAITFDEKSSEKELLSLLALIAQAIGKTAPQSVSSPNCEYSSDYARESAFLEQKVFNAYHSETEFLRYVKRLEAKDLSLCHSMIPLGSCTMKLNATSEMLPVSFPGFSSLHPFAPESQFAGYKQLFSELESALAEMTGFDCVSLQPNSGAQGEYAGLMAIKSYLEACGQNERNICLIPMSAHGTNPASAIMAGFQVKAVACDQSGNIDKIDLKGKIEEVGDKLGALMITYPSTHGVFEEGIEEVCEAVHRAGGQVYLDGANLNALVGIAKPAHFGADVCHFNLHKTFCIPHGGGGPGMGPIAAKAHLEAHLPGHQIHQLGEKRSEQAVSAAPWGSASILPISWAYLKMMGAEKIRYASQLAILNANYIAAKLHPHFPVLYKGKNGLVAHECILDLRSFKALGIEAEDISKRLMDYGFHSPTLSWPVAGTLMVEPTESESLAELDLFCDAMIAIRKEIAAVESGEFGQSDNPLKNAPHTASALVNADWAHPYSRESAVFPLSWVRERKFWPSVSRVDSSFGDRNLVCSCEGMESYTE